MPTFRRGRANMYAHDTSILNVETNLKMLETATSKVIQYFESTNFYTNVNKINVILFQTKQSKFVSGLKVFINNDKTSEVKRTDVLGVVIDSNLTWEKQRDKIYNKISKNLL
jgi:hypothetical protein